MKKFLIIAILLILAYAQTWAQTIIAGTTPVSKIFALKAGKYLIINAPGDSTYFTLDTALLIRKDTIKTVCPAIDSVSIQKLKICPAPVPIPKPRTAINIVWDFISNKKTILYDDGSTSQL